MDEIIKKIQSSVLGPDEKRFLLQNLEKMNEGQKSELLALLTEAEKLMEEEVARIKSGAFKRLAIKMNNLFRISLKNARVKVEEKVSKDEKVDLENLDQSLKNA